MMTSVHGRTRAAYYTGKFRRFRRPVTAFIVAYAFAIQSLIASVAGPPSNGNAGLSAFVLCLNGDHEAPVAPADAPGDGCGNHCLYTAGTQPLLDTPLPHQVQLLNVEIGTVHSQIDHHQRSTINSYAIAQPRAPPLSA
jgi:hypothetical protein